MNKSWSGIAIELDKERSLNALLHDEEKKISRSTFATTPKRKSDWDLLKQKALDDNNLELLKDMAEIELK